MPRPAVALALAIIALVAAAGRAAAAPLAEPAAEPPVRRIALLFGADDGGRDRVRLRYAGSDAARMARVIRELGGVAHGDAILRRSSARGELVAGLDLARAKVEAAQRAGARTELIVYYSGHSDEQGLLLGGDRLSYAELRDRIRAIPSDVHVAVLDSCASGAFTRLKGGAARPSFLIDASSRVTGYAFISSSSADEAAQESNRIAASYFTHAFASGLRGGADANRDGKVTLNEAYQFAFAETVSRTESSQAGAQHPAYNLHLAGTGDVVMTDLRATTATLLLAGALDGRLFVRDAGGALVVELAKTPGRAVELGLAPGSYQLTLRSGDRLYAARATLAVGRHVELDLTAFRAADLERTVSRGGPPGQTEAMTDVPFALSLVAPLSTHAGIERPRKRMSINVVSGTATAIDGVELGGLVNQTDEWVRGIQVAGLANLVSGGVRGIQVAGLVNLDGGEVQGIQVAGLVNLDGGGIRGIQVAGLGNLANRDARAVQLAGLGNAVTGELRGGQIAGLGNLAPEGGRGLQLAGLGNVAGDLRGLQVAGLLNVADAVGAQLGAVNVAGRVRGAQLGVVNVARESDVSLGLINVVGNGHRALEVWASDTAPLNVGVKLGARRTYSMLAVAADDDILMFGAALGVHTDRGGYWIDVDVGNHGVVDHGFHETDTSMLSQLRAALGWRFNDDLALFAGAQLSAGFAFGDRRGTDPSPLTVETIERDDVVLRLAPGLFAGASAF